MTPVAIALGSNLGDRDAHLAFAVARLRCLLEDVRVSSWHETRPVDAPGQPDFLNGALTGLTQLGPATLLRALLAIEQERGRTRPFQKAPRTLDLDLILFGAAVIDEPGLRVPHPDFRRRSFVLAPLAEIAAGWVDAETGKTVEELLRGLAT